MTSGYDKIEAFVSVQKAAAAGAVFKALIIVLKEHTLPSI
jgi:hypothetical protein